MVDFSYEWMENGRVHLTCVGLDELETQEEGLEAAIEKWEVAAHFYVLYPDLLLSTRGRLTCGLCYTTGLSCDGCLIHENTRQGCMGTPIQDYAEATEAQDPVRAYEAARAEIAFLKSLQ